MNEGEPAQVALTADVLERYPRFSLYNSPYPAHDDARAIDLYPSGNVGVSPVAGEVLDTRTVRCPDRPYAVAHDHLVLVDTGTAVARLLHVDPAVEPGDRVAVGDPVGELVRSGFFGRWVDNHLHLEFRPPDRDAYRASGSLPVRAGVDVEPLAWDGTGTVVETGDSYALLDAPTPSGDGYAAIASDGGVPLDGGMAHYGAGGLLGPCAAGVPDCDPTVRLLGEPVGTADGRDVAWGDVAVLANGERVTGLSLFAWRGARWGAKLVTRPTAGDPAFAVGDRIEVAIRPCTDPVRLD